MVDSTINIKEDFGPVSKEQWLEVVERDLKGASFEKKLVTPTYDGVPIQPAYNGEDWDSTGDPSGFPGMAPFTRGSLPLGQSQAGWEICQEYRHPSAEETGVQIATDLERGSQAVVLRLDASGRQGLEPGDAGDQLGQGGVVLTTSEALAKALEKVLLDVAAVKLDAGAQFYAAAAALAAVWGQRGIADDEAKGAFNADPLGTLAAEGKLLGSLEDAMAQMADLASATAKRYAKVTAVKVDTSAYHVSGASSVQDLACAIATGAAYVKAMTEAGMNVDDACRQIVFHFSVGTNQFLAIAKLRAARKLWANVAAAFGASERGQAMNILAKTADRVVTVRDPWVNMLRGTITCFSAAVAGANSILVAPYDKGCGLSSGLSRRIARNTQIILQEESHLSHVVDPGGGSWFIEKFTDQLAEQAWGIFQEIEKQGGMVKALTSGWIKEQVESTYAARLKNLGRRKDPVTGVSEFPNLGETNVKVETPDLTTVVKLATEQAKAAESNADAKTALGKIAADNRFDAAVDAATAGASLVQIGAALAQGEACSIDSLEAHPFAAPFEEMRAASDLWLAQHGSRPKVFLANMGPVAHHTARATFSKNFFEAGGLEAVGNNGFKTAEEAAEAFKASGAEVAIICSSDKLYPDFIPQVTPALKAAGARTVILAGHPGENKEAWEQAGIDQFIYIGCDVLGTLQTLLKEYGVIA